MARFGLNLKKIGLVAALLLFFGSAAALAVSMGSSSELLYSRQPDGQGGTTITAYLGSGFRKVVVPEKLDGLPVTGLGPGAFWGNTEIVEVELPMTVMRLGSNAFADCTQLAAVIAPGACELGDYLFFDCKALERVTLGCELSLIGEQPFGDVRPVVSVAADAGVAGLLRLLEQLEPSVQDLRRGSVGLREITDDVLEQYIQLAYYLRIPTQDAEMLWQAGGGEEKRSFIQYSNAVRGSGLYEALTEEEKNGLDQRLNRLYEDFMEDADRLLP